MGAPTLMAAGMQAGGGLMGFFSSRDSAKEAEKIGAKEAAAAQVRALAGMSDLLGGRTRPPREGDLVKVPGAPPGDARYAGPPLRAVARPSWTARRVM